MKERIKVVLIGAGSAIFGGRCIADLLAAEDLKKTDLTIALVDIDEQALERMYKYAGLVKEYRGSKANILASGERREALKGADYVITAVSRKRWVLWDEDLLISSACGFRSVLAENGGPGAAFHTMRSLHLMIPIGRDMEEICPKALLLNYTNPESRVCLAMNKLTRIRTVGLCHNIYETTREVARILERREEELDIITGGLNHFHFVLSVRDRATGEELRPELHRRLDESDCGIDPLSLEMYRLYRIFPQPSPSHIGEYVGYAYDIVGPMRLRGRPKIYAQDPQGYVSVPGRKAPRWEMVRRVVAGEEPITEDLVAPSRELAIPIICDTELDRNGYQIAVNIPNTGFAISNLPEDGVVEIPARVDAKGIHPVAVGPLPEAIAALCRTQISIQKMLVEAYAQKSKNLLLQALSLDPIVDSMRRARRMTEEMLRMQADFLPEFE